VRLLFRKAKSVAKQLRRIGYVVNDEVRIHQQVEHRASSRSTSSDEAQLANLDTLFC